MDTAKFLGTRPRAQTFPCKLATNGWKNGAISLERRYTFASELFASILLKVIRSSHTGFKDRSPPTESESSRLFRTWSSSPHYWMNPAPPRMLPLQLLSSVFSCSHYQPGDISNHDPRPCLIYQRARPAAVGVTPVHCPGKASRNRFPHSRTHGRSLADWQAQRHVPAGFEVNVLSPAGSGMTHLRETSRKTTVSLLGA